MIFYRSTIIKRIILAALALLLLAGFIFKSHRVLYIPRDEALEIALDHAGLHNEDIFDTEIEFERDLNSAWYEIEFNSNMGEHEYTMDAESGEILFSVC